MRLLLPALLLTACPWFNSEPNPRAPVHRPLVALLWDPHRAGHAPMPVDKVEEALFGAQASSLSSFYRDQSGDTVLIEKAAVLGWYDADKPSDHYWNHPADANDGFKSGHVEKWAEVVKKSDPDFDFAAYDKDHDGMVSANELAVLIVIPQAGPFGSNREPLARELPSRQSLKVDGVVIPQIAEVYLPVSGNPGVIRHELGHLWFRFPDLYANKRYPNNGAGEYCIMSVSYTDAQVGAPLRFQQGWLATQEVTATGEYPATRALIYHRKHGSAREYFLIEQRLSGDYDTQLPARGLVAWRVVDDGDPEEIYRVRPNDAHVLRESDLPLRLTWADGSASPLTIEGFAASAPDKLRLSVK